MYKCHICRNTSIDLISLQKHINMTHEVKEPISAITTYPKQIMVKLKEIKQVFHATKLLRQVCTK